MKHPPKGSVVGDIRLKPRRGDPGAGPQPPAQRPPNGLLNVSSLESPGSWQGEPSLQATVAGTKQGVLHHLPFKTHTFQMSPEPRFSKHFIPRGRGRAPALSAQRLCTRSFPAFFPACEPWSWKGEDVFQAKQFWAKKRMFSSVAGAALKDARQGTREGSGVSGDAGPPVGSEGGSSTHLCR